MIQKKIIQKKIIQKKMIKKKMIKKKMIQKKIIQKKMIQKKMIQKKINNLPKKTICPIQYLAMKMIPKPTTKILIVISLIKKKIKR